jgi:mannose-1-phosphate guanylyltransferase
MAGGRGERFWPQSRLKKPKHLLPIVGTQPMLTQTIARVRPLVSNRNILVITTLGQLAAVRVACTGLPRRNIIVEPVGRDTAAAVGLAMLLVKARSPNAAFAVLPADHVIGDVPGFRRLLKAAFKAAESADELVTLGIEPTEPATGFGYIERGAAWQDRPTPILRARRFVEKPSLAKAKGYLATKRYYWNAGMFVWRVPVIAAALARHAPKLSAGLVLLEAALSRANADKALARHAPKLSAGLVLLEAALSRANADKALARLYPNLEKISIDFAVMEKARNVLVVPANFGWDDVGSWTAVARHHAKDSAGNILRGMACVEAGRQNIVISSGRHLTAVLGLDNIVVVHTPDATLVCPKDRAQEIKSILQRLHDDPKTKKYL